MGVANNYAECQEGSTNKGAIVKMNIYNAARAGVLSALQDAIKRGEDVNSVDRVSWFVGM